MMKEAGGVATEKAKQIKSEQLFGIELYRKVYALACANMLIHKDGKTNLRQMDAMSEDAADFIRDSNITKVLMNPPYERKYGCMRIVTNVLDNVPTGTKAAFILPNTKLDKDGGKKLLKNHTLETIVRLPSKTFINVGVETAIFIFTAGIAHPKHQKIQSYYIQEDGLETVKNQGRHDINGLWENDYEDYWVAAIANHEDDRYGTRLPIDPNERLSYPDPEVPFELNMEDFMKVAMDYHMFETGTDTSDGLLPCAFQVMFDVRQSDGTIYIDATLTQRSNDMLVAHHINAMQYVALQLMIAKHFGWTPGNFYYFINNLHIYDNQFEQAKELLNRTPSNQNPQLILDVPDGTNFYDIKANDFKLINYDPVKPQLTFDLTI